MKFLKDIQNFFKKELTEPESKPEVEEPVEEEPVNLPDEITIDWAECAWHLNLVREYKTLRGDMGKYFFEVREKELQFWEALKKYEKLINDRINELREKKNIPSDYKFVGPASTGETGKFKKS